MTLCCKSVVVVESLSKESLDIITCYPGLFLPIEKRKHYALLFPVVFGKYKLARLNCILRCKIRRNVRTSLR